MGSTFQAQIDDYFVIPGTYTSAGGTTNFNFGYLLTYRVRARDARIRVMHAEHHLSDLKFEAA
jgi:hypothetical protein